MPIYPEYERPGTGHRHWFDTDKPVVFEDEGADQCVILDEDTVLIHSGPDGEPVWTKEEAQKKDLHVALNIPVGRYIVLRERDHDPFTNRNRIVAD